MNRRFFAAMTIGLALSLVSTTLSYARGGSSGGGNWSRGQNRGQCIYADSRGAGISENVREQNRERERLRVHVDEDAIETRDRERERERERQRIYRW